jgi:hypothetical protein
MTEDETAALSEKTDSGDAVAPEEAADGDLFEDTGETWAKGRRRKRCGERWWGEEIQRESAGQVPIQFYRSRKSDKDYVLAPRGRIISPLSRLRRKSVKDLEKKPNEEPPPADMTAKENMGRRLKTEEGKEIYGKRKETVEPVFGIIKQTMGFRQFLLRGLEKVNTEWKLVTLSYNFKKLHGLTYGISLPKCPLMA